MKKGTTYILICLTVVMSLIGLLIWYNVTKTAGEKNPLDADVTLNGNTTTELSVDFKDLKPGSDGQRLFRRTQISRRRTNKRLYRR